jgi:peptidoglycan biosynthesis protein MviN/MurJ (putative lipid II flippase)
LATLFVVHRKTVFNMWVGIANVVLNVALNFILRPVMGVPGIALSTTLTVAILSCAYVAGMYRRWGGFAPGTVRAVVARTTASVAATLMAGLAVLAALPSPSGRASALLIAAVGLATGVAAQGVVLGAERHLGCRVRNRFGTIGRSAAVER